ncbi:MAG: hypothetical protein AAF918_07765 [Pseudomonadota bacterium]
MLISSSALAKQEIIKIEISGASLPSPISITNRQTVSQFSIWNGPGTASYDGNGDPNPPSHLERNSSERRFIDWPEGTVAEPSANARHFDVTFFLGRTPNQRRYPFSYALDGNSARGLVYLPCVSTNVIWHGVEGNWFYASSKWDELIAPLISTPGEWLVVPER